jgi:hypothetical protein
MVMPFGLSNAPAAFQRMNDTFSDMIDVCVVVYLNDILIYSADTASHKKQVKEVLCCLRKAGLYAHADKCEFHTERVEYLGYILSPDGLSMAQDKIQTIRDWPEPQKVKDVQSFLGFANFYRRFIYNYSDIVVPLTRLTHKNTKFDFDNKDHLVRIAEGDEPKTTFRTRYGSFEWRVMPFGLSNVPAAFQRFMNDIFSDMIDVCVVVYLDDILIYSANTASHRKQVEEVLHHLRKAGLYARADKCEFHAESVEYLGYILSPDGLSMAQDKVQTIRDWPEPRKVKDVQSFLGFANFYRRFIYNYSDIVVPLTRLTHKNTKFDFDDNAPPSTSSKTPSPLPRF